jgi:hypothetical protein
MRSRFRTWLACLGLAVPSAAALASPQAPATLDREAQEIKSYRLSMATLSKLGAVYQALAAVAATDPDYKRLQTAKQELKALEAKEEPTDADLARIEALGRECHFVETFIDER